MGVKPVAGIDPSQRPTRAWLALQVSAFLDADPEDLLRRLIARSVERYASHRDELTESWRDTIVALQTALVAVADEVVLDGLLIEFPLLRLGRRIDVVLLRGEVVVIVEVKAGRGSAAGGAVTQVEDYALSLRDFHAPCRDLTLLPIAAGGTPMVPAHPLRLSIVDQVAEVVRLPLSDLSWALRVANRHARPGISGPSLEAFDQGAYLPTPTIVEAAKQAYADHEVDAIRRMDAPGRALQAAALTLQTIISEARVAREHVICFVTGTPGAGKTLLGLDLVLRSAAGRENGESAAFLSGNRPLVKVLQEALLEDESVRVGATKASLRLKVEGALQTLLGFLREYTDDVMRLPSEHVVVFDEAQRAWDAATGEKLLKRASSEPELFLDIMGRLDWSCLVCLVGGGQEINRGELGLPLWVDALRKANASGGRWRVVSPPNVVEQSVEPLGFAEPVATPLRITSARSHALEGSLRAFRNTQQTAWLTALLDGDLDAAAAHAAQGQGPPAYLCRTLEEARSWLALRRRGGRRVGLMASSAARRLIAEGLPPTLMSKDLGAIAHWFLKPEGDFRSSNALELALSEYGVQGLEIDYAGVCWGGDLLWSEGRWQARDMKAPRWTIVRQEDSRQFRVNSYRVLLSRSRAGQVIFVPRGCSSDPTRSPTELDGVADALLRAGVVPLAAERGDVVPTP